MSSTPEPAENAEKVEIDQQIELREREELTTYTTELSARIQSKSVLRQENLSCIRPSEEYFARLDSSLKKNTAFVKRLKQFSAGQLDGFVKDMTGLNLTKYISEVSSSLVEAKLKMTDVAAAITLCSKLHQVYGDFSPAFFDNWLKILAIKPGEKLANSSKTRVDLRFFAELISVGVFSNKMGLPLLGTTLTGLIQSDREDHGNLSIILSFCRNCGEEYAGLVNRNIYTLAKKYNVELPAYALLTSDKQQNLRNLLKDYYYTLCKHLYSEHKSYQQAIRTNRNILASKGEVSNERKEKLELMQSNFEKLSVSVQAMAELLNENMPELPKDEEDPIKGMVLENDDLNESQLDPWGDEETKSFYIDLPDLRVFLPNYAPKQEPLPAEPAMTEETLDMDIEPELLQVDVNELPPNMDEANSPVSSEPILEETAAPATATASGAAHSTRQQFEVFLSNLVNCVNKELIDSAAIEFLLNLNTKNNRKKLANSLFGVQRTRLDILPFFARLTATINLVSTDVATELCQKLKNEFKYHINKKNQMTIESKIKVVRFIGEMVKFGLYSKIEALFCLKVLLLDFQHHQIEMTCAFLEVAGQYLYNSRDSRLRTNVYLEQMMRLKTATALDSRHVAQIENSYYLVKPPEGQNTVQKIRPPMHQYIRHLIFKDLNKSNVDKVIKIMRRLNWDDKAVNAYTIKCLSKAYNVRYHLIRCLADLVSGISSYQDKAMVKVIDTVFEDIRAGLEIHSPKLAQRRIAMAKYLGELYNYRLVESSNILNTLYSIISLGVTLDAQVVSELDPPESLFRLKLACVLLDTCGQYFTSPVSRKRLDYFLIFFQQYYWFKKSHPIFSTVDGTQDLFPILVDHMYKECLSNVRPKLKLFKSYEQAKEAVEKLRLQLYPTLFQSSGKDGGGDFGETNTLEPIVEDAELSNELTEDTTSEAVGESDDAIRGENENDEDDDDDDDDSIERTESPEALPKEKERTQEDVEFEQAFEKLAIDSYQERLRDTIKPSTKDIPVPIMAKSGGKKTYDQLQANEPIPSETSVPFVLMLRGAKGGKQQFKTFAAAVDSQLAINLRLQEEQIREEKEKVKRLTLNITERIEEEDYQISLLQSQRTAAEQRSSQKSSSKQKYKHQKGAPDADLIFS